MEEYSHPPDQGVDPIVEEGDTQSRGPISGSKLSATVTSNIRRMDAELYAAMDQGNYSNAQLDPTVKVERRALLVAVRYRSWPSSTNGRPLWERLESTPYDVWRIYKMLLDRGYSASDVRILAEGIKRGEQYDPTKSNIIAGLNWLAKGAHENSKAYRYFHFSGHGDAFETNPETGKEAREIRQVNPYNLKDPRYPLPNKDDNEYYPPDHDSTERYKRRSSQTIPEEELKYYNEALMTYYEPPPPRMEDPDQIADYNRVRDNELNEIFSKLPKGCMVMTTLDCCHSGRMLSNNFKLKGPGFRGTLIGPEGQSEVQGSLSDQVRDLKLGDIHMKDSKTIRNESVDPRTLEVTVFPRPGVRAPTISEGSNLPKDQEAGESEQPHVSEPVLDGYFEFRARPRNFFSPPNIKSVAFSMLDKLKGPSKPKTIRMNERLPTDEASRDNIQATIMAWSGCHQRQLSSDYRNWQGGFFTLAFTSAISELAKNGQPTVEGVYNKTNELLEEAIVKRNQKEDPKWFSYSLQYTQLWTSLGGGEEAEALAKLNKPFDLIIGAIDSE